MRSFHQTRRFSRRFRPLRIELLEDRLVPSFLALRSFDAREASSLAVADLNGDGFLDLATGGSALLGNGDGSFQAPRPFAAGNRPIAVASGEFNGDGQADLAVVNLGECCPWRDGSVSILVGNGDGSFQAAQHFAVGTRPLSVAVGEFNGDGQTDLAVANGDSANVSVLLGNGDGSFQPARSFAASGTGSVAVADLNGDGLLDLVTNLSVLLGNGDGSFQAARDFAAGIRPLGVVVGDVNGDGLLDLAVANAADCCWRDGGVSILVGNGDGTFQAPRTIALGSNPSSVALGEVNGDGSLDLVVANNDQNNDTVGVFLGNGDGTFRAARQLVAGSIPRFAALADVNGDGWLDLAAVNAGSSSVSVLLGNGDGFVAPAARRYGAGSDPRFVAAQDVNGDGLPDLAVTNGGSATVGVLLGNGDGSFQAARRFPVEVPPSFVAVADINGDGRPDLAVTTGASVSVLLGAGNGTFAVAGSFPTGSESDSVATGDFNGDDLVDLAVAHQSGRTVSVLLGNGDGSFQAARHFSGGNGPVSVAVGDVNGDGLLDLAVANYGPGSNTVVVLLGNGDGSFQTAQHLAVTDAHRAVVLTDVNGDGLLDLAVANYGRGSDTVSVLLGNGDGTFQTPQHYFVGQWVNSVTVADANGDGNLDLITAASPLNTAMAVSGTVRVLLGNGDGTFRTTNLSYFAGVYPRSVAVADFDSDGWIDLTVANRPTGEVSILLNAADDAANLYLDAAAQVPAGQAFDLTMYALSGDWLRLAHGYRGTIAFWSSDEQATLPEPFSLRPEDWGIASFPGGLTLRTPGMQELYAFDLATFTVIGYAVVEVLGAAPGSGPAGGPALDLFAAEVLADVGTLTGAVDHSEAFLKAISAKPGPRKRA